MKVFILGPMATVRGFNFDRFDAAELYLITLNVLPVNPAHFRREQMQIDPQDYPNGMWEDNRRLSQAKAAKYAAMAIGYDTATMMECDMVAILPEAQHSEHCHNLCNLARAGGKSIIELHPNCIDTTPPRREPPAAPQGAILPINPPVFPSQEAA